MENAHQETPQADNLMDLWTNAATECWSSMWEMGFLNPALKWQEKANGNGRGAYMGWKPCFKMWEAFTHTMTNPDTIASLPKAFGNFPETLMKMQQNELDRYKQMQTLWMQKMESMEKVVRLMCMRML